MRGRTLCLIWRQVLHLIGPVRAANQFKWGPLEGWMLVFMRAICVRADAIERKVRNEGPWPKSRYIEAKPVVGDQQQRSATTERRDAEYLDPAFLLLLIWLVRAPRGVLVTVTARQRRCSPLPQRGPQL